MKPVGAFTLMTLYMVASTIAQAYVVPNTQNGENKNKYLKYKTVKIYTYSI